MSRMHRLAHTALLMLASIGTCTALAVTKRQAGSSGTLFGPITLPSVSISNISLTLINFNDEVFDISSISVFGDINDGSCTEVQDSPQPVASETGQTVVLGPAQVPWSNVDISNVQATLINFNDEVFDISSISVFGDINDGVCQPAA